MVNLRCTGKKKYITCLNAVDSFQENRKDATKEQKE